MIVDMLTEQLGRISFIVRVGKKGSAATKRQFFQPLTLLELAFDYRENVGLQKLNDIKIAHPFNSIFFDPFKCSIALFVAEFLYHATKSEAQTALSPLPSHARVTRTQPFFVFCLHTFTHPGNQLMHNELGVKVSPPFFLHPALHPPHRSLPRNDRGQK